MSQSRDERLGVRLRSRLGVRLRVRDWEGEDENGILLMVWNSM